MPTNPNIELRSEPVQEIIGKDPNWIIRWGITVLALTVVVMLIGTWIIQYPEIITARVSITTQTPPVRIVARSSGKIVSIFVEEGDTVTAGQYLAVLENTADYDSISFLRELRQDFPKFLIDTDSLLDRELDSDLNLGDLQLAYSDLMTAISDYRSFVKEDFYTQKIEMARSQTKHYQKLGQQLSQQLNTLGQDLQLREKKYQKTKNLFDQKLVPETELAAVEGQYLEKKYGLESAQTGLTNNQLRIDELRGQIAEYQQERRDRQRILMLNTQQVLKKLNSDFTRWEQQFILKSPADGHISFFKFWTDNQYVSMGDEVMIVIPGKDELVGRIYLPQYGSGKVALGQQVNVKLDSFPFREFGMVQGEIKTTSLIARDNQYLINISFPDGLQTTYGKQLGFKHNMEGSADIITRDLRLIERIFNQFRHLFDSKLKND